MGLKPAGPWETEEDEGFSDWSQKLVQRKLRGAAQAAEEQEEPRFTDGEQTEQTRATEELHTYNTEAQVEEEDEGTTRNEEVEVGKWKITLRRCHCCRMTIHFIESSQK